MLVLELVLLLGKELQVALAPGKELELVLPPGKKLELAIGKELEPDLVLVLAVRN